MIDIGIYKTLSNKDYHADKNSISRSALIDFKKNPRYYWAWHVNPNRPVKKQTEAMIFGSAFHCYVLEPDKFYETYAVEPTKVLLKNEGETAYRIYKNQCEELARSSKIVLSHETYDELTLMHYELFENIKAAELIRKARYEQSYFWKDDESGLMLKARPDILHENMIVDIKTIDDASPHGFQRAMMKGSYHIQGAMIRDAVRILEGRDIPNIINICIEKTYPYSIGIYIIDEEAINSGQQEYKQLCLDLANAIKYNQFDDYEPQTIGLPKWAL